MDNENSLFRMGGRFTLGRDDIEAAPDMVLLVMGTVIVLDARYHLFTNTIEYEALSPHFEEVPEGGVFPLYEVAIDTDTNEVTWTKKV